MNTLNPLRLVVATQLGICGCHLTSFVSWLPECTKRSWGGISPSTAPSPAGADAPGPSSSMLRSYTYVPWSSETAIMDSSVGCHSRDVIGVRWEWNRASGLGDEPSGVWKVRRSQTEKEPVRFVVLWVR